MQRAWAFKPKILPSTASTNLKAGSTACYQLLCTSRSSLTSPVCTSVSQASHSGRKCRSFSTTTVNSAGGPRTQPKGTSSKSSDRPRLNGSAELEGKSKGRGPMKRRAVISRKSSPAATAREEIKQIAADLALPSKNDFPIMATVLKDPASHLKPKVSLLEGFEESSSIRGKTAKHVLRVIDTTGEEIRTSASASQPSVAKSVAYLKILARLHEKGYTNTVLPFDANTIKEEKNAILDVYLYAARYGDIPQIETKDVSLWRKTATTPRFEVNVELPLLGIKSTGRGRSIPMADMAAGYNTKQAIERLLLEQGTTIQPTSEDDTWGLKSATDFCQWYQYLQRGTTIEYRTETDKKEVSRSNTILTKNEEPREFPVVTFSNKKTAEGLAALVTAITLTREDPSLRERFFKEYKLNHGQVLPPLPPVQFDMADDTYDAIGRAIKASYLATEQLETREEVEEDENRRPTIYQSLLEDRYKRKSEELQKRRTIYQTRNDLEQLRKTRSEYPMNQHATDVLKTIGSNIYSIIIGATGSGKTTQVPQILLNDAIERGEGAGCNVICTQPRRIAAKSVAQRVADERAEFLGDCVGYHVRQDSKLPTYGGSINFCTTGILSQQLQFAADDIMDNASHLIIDEVHERDTVIDFLLTSLKRLVKERVANGKKVPHIILMSATIDQELFADYLRVESASGETIDCPTMFVPGRTFPVKEYYLEDVIKQVDKTGDEMKELLRDRDTGKYITFEREFARENKNAFDDEEQEESAQGVAIDWARERRKATTKGKLSFEEQEQALVPHTLAAATIAHITKSTTDGAILTFLPGLDDITKIDEILRQSKSYGLDFNDSSKYKIFMLHSSIQHTQRDVFEPMPPGCRKIILATNIAETSITIPDVQHVVDTGKLRELQYDQARRITRLACVWASKSNAKQRAGRAGRVQDGNYYALFSRERYESLRAVGLPELLRSDLQETCLNIKKQGFDVPVKQFLAETIEPPSPEAIDLALDSLVSLQALERNESLTPLGNLLGSLPIHPSLGKMIILGIIFRCLDPMLIIGASFSERSIFARPLERKREANEARSKFAKNTLSDHIGALAAVKELRMLDEVRGPRALTDFAMRNYLHVGAYRNIISIAQTIEQLLVEHRVISRIPRMNRVQCQFGDPRLNENSDKVGLVKALLLAGFYPNLGVRRGRTSYRTLREANTFVHPGSINATDLKALKSKKILPPPDLRSELLTFSELTKSADGHFMYLRDTTPVTPLTSVLFSRVLSHRSRNILRMDEWLSLYSKQPEHVTKMLHLHAVVRKVMASAFQDLASRRSLSEHEGRNRFADALVEVLDLDLMFRSRGSHAPRPQAAFDSPSEGSSSSNFNFRGAENSDPVQPTNKKTWDTLIAEWSKKSPSSADRSGNGFNGIITEQGGNKSLTERRY